MTDESNIQKDAIVEGESTNTNTNTATGTTEQKYTKEDLIELIRAIKFSNPTASIRNVHTEIQTKMSQNESFEFLADVKLNDVKKVWKKAITGGNNSGGNASAATATSANTNATTSTGTSTSTSAEKNNNILPELMNNSNHNSNKSKKDSKETILKFYTVGDGSVKTLAKNYTLQAAAKAIEEEKDNLEAKKEKDEEEIMKKYVSCFLDVPADRSGGKPHQALINFNNKSSKKGSKNTKADGRDIVKIQVAAPLPGMSNTPMLVYNLDRSAKTFIHDDDDDENKGYEKIKSMIGSHGVSGALSDGGTKAYFYSRITRRKGEQDLISIDVSELAPPQKW